MDNIDRCKNWYEDSYKTLGINAQRQYPNDELCRFMGRNYFSIDIKKRNQMKFLELGCGSGGNLWMVAKEGFLAYGIDLSEESIKIAKNHLNKKWGVQAELQVANMVKLPYEGNFFNAIFDVFSSYCLLYEDFKNCINEVSRCLVKGGRFFFYSPSVGSDAFKNYSPAQKIDSWTIDSISRKTSPFYGQNYPFRFASEEDCRQLFENAGMEVVYSEKINRTYQNGAEKFEFVVMEAVK